MPLFTTELRPANAVARCHSHSSFVSSTRKRDRAARRPSRTGLPANGIGLQKHRGDVDAKEDHSGHAVKAILH